MTTSGLKRNLLIVDDDSETLELLSVQFKNQDFKFRIESDPEHALELLDKESYQAVLTDLDMPGMDGIQLIKSIKSRHPTVTCHILSGRADPHEIIEVINAVPVFSYIKKPWDRESLLINLLNGFEIHQLHRERDQLLLRSHKLNGELLNLNHEIEKKLNLAGRSIEISDLIHAFILGNSALEERDSLKQLLNNLEPLTFYYFEKKGKEWDLQAEGAVDKIIPQCLDDELVKKISSSENAFKEWGMKHFSDPYFEGNCLAFTIGEEKSLMIYLALDEFSQSFLNQYDHHLKRALQVLLQTAYGPNRNII